jgi:hypothetical protein
MNKAGQDNALARRCSFGGKTLQAVLHRRQRGTHRQRNRSARLGRAQTSIVISPLSFSWVISPVAPSIACNQNINGSELLPAQPEQNRMEPSDRLQQELVTGLARNTQLGIRILGMELAVGVRYCGAAAKH